MLLVDPSWLANMLGSQVAYFLVIFSVFVRIQMKMGWRSSVLSCVLIMTAQHPKDPARLSFCLSKNMLCLDYGKGCI